jgi:hypothetical protein
MENLASLGNSCANAGAKHASDRTLAQTAILAEHLIFPSLWFHTQVVSIAGQILAYLKLRVEKNLVPALPAGTAHVAGEATKTKLRLSALRRPRRADEGKIAVPRQRRACAK